MKPSPASRRYAGHHQTATGTEPFRRLSVAAQPVATATRAAHGDVSVSPPSDVAHELLEDSVIGAKDGTPLVPEVEPDSSDNVSKNAEP